MKNVTSNGIRTIQAEVEELLVKNPDARSSDETLYGYYIVDKIGLVSAVSFFFNFPKHNVASFETVSRARRKVQETHPELQATKQVQEARDELQGTFFDYARGL